MKKLLAFLFILISYSAFAQYPGDSKRDYAWMFGYYNSPPNWGGTELNFNISPPSLNYVSQQINLDLTNASICNMSGELLFYTNGMYVANANHQIMPNGDSLNPGDVFNYYEDLGYREMQGALILPKPGSSNLFYIFHKKLEWNNQYFQLCTGLFYSLVDMNIDNGLGDVTSKNNIILTDSLDPGLLTATRHANGRDWWILVPEFLHNRYYTYLISPEGIQFKGMQTLGTASNTMEVGYARFTPDGSKYIRFAGVDANLPFRLEIFNFNRCSGLLSNYNNLWYIDNAFPSGIEISSNSRYLYVSAESRIDQYDLQAENIVASKQIVAVYDGFIDPIFSLGSTYFLFEQLAPDNKIYISTTNSTHYLHVINNPDSGGIACNVQQHAIHLNTFNDMSLPNFPNFRLGAIPCSTCDTLGLGGAVIEGKLMYDNALSTAMDSCWVVLKTISGNVVDSSLTNQNGEYRFCGIQPGSYKAYPKTTKAWGGVNNIDALKVMRHFTGLDNLMGLFLQSGDISTG